MKKLIALILALVTLLSMSTVAMADTITVDGNQTANTTVTYGVETSYTVIIPDTIRLVEGEFQQLDITTTNVLLPANYELSISVYTDFMLTDRNDASNKLEYCMTWQEDYADFIYDGELLVCREAGYTGDDTATVWLALVDEVTKAGEYIGSMTFEVDVYELGVVDSVIEFDIAGVVYEAREGMTWAEWCDSEYNHDARWYIYDNGQVVDWDLQYITNPGTTIAARGNDVIIVDGQYGQLSY